MLKEKITFIFNTDDEKKGFVQCIDESMLKQDVIEKSNDLFVRSKKVLYNDINSFITLLISGGTITAVIVAIKEIIIKYLEKGYTEITIQNGNRKLDIKYNNSKSIEEIVNDELIEKLFVSENEKEN